MHERIKNLIMLLCLIIVLFSQVAQLSRSEILGLAITPTATPWVKQDVLIKILPSGMKIWTDNARVLVAEAIMNRLTKNVTRQGGQIG